MNSVYQAVFSNRLGMRLVHVGHLVWSLVSLVVLIILVFSLTQLVYTCTLSVQAELHDPHEVNWILDCTFPNQDAVVR